MKKLQFGTGADFDAFFLLTDDSECHYKKAFHDGRIVKPAFAVRMKGKTPPKWRKVCVDCCHRMDEDSLLNRIRELVSDPKMPRMSLWYPWRDIAS